MFNNFADNSNTHNRYLIYIGHFRLCGDRHCVRVSEWVSVHLLLYNWCYCYWTITKSTKVEEQQQEGGGGGRIMHFIAIAFIYCFTCSWDIGMETNWNKTTSFLYFHSFEPLALSHLYTCRNLGYFCKTHIPNSNMVFATMHNNVAGVRSSF